MKPNFENELNSNLPNRENLALMTTTFKDSGTPEYSLVKFMFSKKATKIDEIFTVDLTLCSKRQIDGEDFVNFRGLLRKYEIY